MNEDHCGIGSAARALSELRNIVLANIRRSRTTGREVQENFQEIPTATLKAMTEQVLCMSLDHFSPS
jgi:hypothetical protein